MLPRNYGHHAKRWLWAGAKSLELKRKNVNSKKTWVWSMPRTHEKGGGIPRHTKAPSKSTPQSEKTRKKTQKTHPARSKQEIDVEGGSKIKR